MELVISKKINYIIPVSLFFCSFVLSLVQLKQTSLPFVLPMLILTFCSSYGHLAIYLLSVTCGLLLTQQIFTLIVIYTLLCVLFVLNIFRVMKTRYLPVFMSLLTIPFLYMNQYPYYDIAFIALFNLINSCFYMELMPLLVHQSSDLYDRKRLMIMMMIIETMIGALAFYHVTYCMIILRYFLLFAIFYLGIEAVMPTLLYTSFLLIVMMPALKEEMLAMILPMSFFFIRQPENKVLFTSLYMLSHMILPLFIGYDERYYAFVVIISAVLFLFSPKIKNKMLSISPDFQEVTYHHQLKNKAESFASLYQQLIDIFKEETKKTNISEYIGFVYEEVCSGCPSRDYCFYSQEGMSRLGKLINKGMTSELDLKDIDYIQRHCLNPDDYLESMAQMRKMGGLSSIMSMMPGLGGFGGKGKMPDLDSEENEKRMARMEAMIYSMTPEERRNPDLLNPSRKHRIARGAGVDIAEVNRMVKQFNESRKMMKKLPGMMGGKGGKRGRFRLPF